MASKNSFCYFISPFNYYTSVVLPAYLLNEEIQTPLAYCGPRLKSLLCFSGLEFEITSHFSHCFINVLMRKYFIYWSHLWIPFLMFSCNLFSNVWKKCFIPIKNLNYLFLWYWLLHWISFRKADVVCFSMTVKKWV